MRERNRSADIPVLTRDEILDLFSVRIPLECLVVRAVLERGAPLTPAREAMAVMEALPDDAGWSQVVAADGAFHHALVRAVGSPRLERLYGSLERRDPALRRPAAAELGVAVGDRARASRGARRAGVGRRAGRRGAHDGASRARRARPHGLTAGAHARAGGPARRARPRRGSPRGRPTSNGRGLLSIRRLMPTDASAIAAQVALRRPRSRPATPGSPISQPQRVDLRHRVAAHQRATAPRSRPGAPAG